VLYSPRIMDTQMDTWVGGPDLLVGRYFRCYQGLELG